VIPGFFLIRIVSFRKACPCVFHKAYTVCSVWGVRNALRFDSYFSIIKKRTGTYQDQEKQCGYSAKVQQNPAKTNQGYKTPAYHCPQDVVVCNKLSHRW